jgi:hypothetical protein
MGLSGKKKSVATETLSAFLKRARRKCTEGIAKALDPSTGLYATYFYYRATEFEELKNDTGAAVLRGGYPVVRVRTMERVGLPCFLEGQVRVMKILPDTHKKNLYDSVRASELFDPKLKMYKLNGSLAQVDPLVGRAPIFPPGWLENESVWMHMEYKYLLEILKAGLHEQFFSDIKSALVPFMDPAVYGRSPLEHSSFIVSSAHPDSSIHGRGYYARLSGATAEWISMYLIIAGISAPFFVDTAGALCFRLSPVLPEWLFTRERSSVPLHTDKGVEEIQVPENAFCCRFLNTCTIFYHNPGRKDTFGNYAASVVSIEFTRADGSIALVDGNGVSGVLAREVREGNVVKINAVLK